MAVPASIDAAARHPWVKPLARAGFAARAAVYFIIGTFAVLAAFGRSEVKGTKGALAALLSQPFGQALLWLAIIGLAGFALWRFVQAWADSDGHGDAAKGLVVRAALAVSGIAHAGLAIFAARMALGWGSGGGDPSGRWIAAGYAAGYGRWLTWAAAAIMLGIAVAQVWKAWRATFDRYFRGCPPEVMGWLRPLARFGLAARGVTFAIIASLIFYGGLRYRGAEGGSTPGLADALQAVQGYAFGWLLLLVVALGLIAFSFYSLAAARYRRVQVT
ncbi:MAG TPA: DUF1206 domain-containing protein [Afifellaceae bacterium]|nr:DUF1206 domain-containing protein [Afifellaceae bacterium]